MADQIVTYDEDHKSSFDADDHIWIVVVGCLLIACLPTILPLFCISKGVFRMYSLSFYVATWIFILYIIASFTLDLKNNYGETTFGTLNIVALPFIMVYYIVVLMESFFCSEKDYISNSYEGEANLTSFLQSLISTKPEVSVYVNCYHYETRTRQVHYTDADGNTQLQMETYLEKVVTVSQQRLFAFLNWLDVSDQNLPKVDGKMLRVKLEKAMTFADEHTRLEFTRFRDNFVAELRGMDQFIEHFEQLEVKGFKEKVTGLAEGRPWWFNRCCLHFSHIILLGWPFRLLVKSSSDQAEFTLTKQISLYKDITNQDTGIYADLSVKNNETAPPRAPDNAYQAGPPRELNNVYQAGPNQQGDVYQAGANMGYDAQTENIYQTIPGEKS